MKVAATSAIAELAREDTHLFGSEYIIPKVCE
jgi:malic enzyme